jgi:hypothetical protein
MNHAIAAAQQFIALSWGDAPPTSVPTVNSSILQIENLTIGKHRLDPAMVGRSIFRQHPHIMMSGLVETII